MEALQERSRGRYRVVDQIGEGSLGSVYRARDLESGEDVALKTISQARVAGDAGLASVRRLFDHEASAAALLSHPGVVRVHDLVEDPEAGEVYLVMEYVDGASLAEILKRPTPIPFDFVAKTIVAVGEVLDYAHSHGVVHRDVKPANILVSAAGEVKVADFGIADLRGHDLASELQGAGSPSYMAPERVLGTASDHRSDVWALGVVLYEMVARRLPFQGESVAELITRIAAEEPAPLDAQGTVVLPGLQQIVDKALAKEPEARYQFAGEIADELQAIQVGQLSLSATLPASSIPGLSAPELEDEVVEEAPSAEPSSAAPPASPRRRWVAASLLSTLLFIALMAIQPASEPVASEVQPVGTEEADADLRRQRLEYLALLEEARALLESGENEAAAELFARAETLSPDARRIRALRDEARRQAEMEVARERAVELAGLVGLAEAEFEAGALASAAELLERALAIDSGHGAALTLSVAVDEARRASERRAERPVRSEPKAVPVVIRTAEPAPAQPMRIEQPIRPPAAAPAPTHSELKVDFFSELPRGVVTVYRDDSQILRRPFRYLEKKGFLRNRAVSGGFDEQLRVPAGATELRVYLSLPGHDTQVHRLSGILPPGAIRSLRVRVGPQGGMSVELH